MSIINDYLDYISTANYGSDVREAIVSSIRECYKDATGHPDSVAALVQEYIDREEKIDGAVTALTGLYNSLGEIVYSYDYNNNISGIHITSGEFGCVDQITLGPGKWMIKVVSFFSRIINASPDVGTIYLSFSNTLDSDGFPIPLNDTYNYKDDLYYGTILKSAGSHINFIKMIELTEEKTIYMWIQHNGQLSDDIVVSPYMTAMRVGESTPSDGTTIADQVVENTENISILDEKVATNTSDISTLDGDVSTLQNDVNDIEDEITDLRQDLSDVIGFDPHINLGDWVNNSYVTANGNFATYNGWHRTDYVDISAYQGKAIHFTNTGNRSEQYNVIYDQNKAKITTFNTNNTDVQIPSNAYYMAISLESTYVVTAKIKYDAYTDRYWLLNRVSFSGNSKPTFNRKSSSILTISFENGATMWALGDNGVGEKKRKVFGADASYDVYSGHPLVWNITDNSVLVLDTNDAIDRYIVLADYNNGKFNFGALLPYFEESQKALITYNYPFYYDTYLQGKIGDINGNMMEVGANGDAFVFITDTHWTRNRKHSPSLIRAILSQTQINKVVHGGDIPYAYATEQEMYDSVREDIEAFDYAVGNKLYRVIGNHDIHATDNTDPNNPIYYELTNNEVYGLLMKKQENRVAYNPSQLSAGYYYFDNEIQKIRYFCLNNFQTPASAFMSNYQVSWIGDKLLELEGEWSAVFIGHASIIQSQNASYARYADIKGLITALANKTAFTASYGRTFDFTNSNVEVVGYFAGHEHIDDIDVVDGVTYILTTCDALLQDDGYGRTANTINEQAFDVIQINTDTKHVDLVRIGAGSDRSFDY